VQICKGFFVNKSKSKTSSPEGLRERKKRETRQHIARVSLGLFLKNGYEETTLDRIAEAAGISRRTIFSYYKSKDDIVLTLQAAAWEALLAELLTTPPETAPLDAVYSALVNYLEPYESEQVRASDGVMRASETLNMRKQAAYIEQEKALYATLCQVWQDPHQFLSLRIVAMVSMGALRLALEAWGTPGNTRTAASCLEDIFAHLQSGDLWGPPVRRFLKP
jgi:AcrR family transcriptional regulator